MIDPARDFPMNGEFLTDCWYVAAWDYELIDGRMLARTILEKPVLLYRGESGQFVALEDQCCHRAAPLSLGRLEGDDVRCMYHGLKFAPSGQCIQVPGQDKVPDQLRVRSYPVVERDHLVWIWMGDPALADESLIVDFPYLGDPAWRGIPDYMHYDANWMFIVDNLADFGHLAWVHTNTLGGSEEYAFKSKPANVERLDDGFRVERWHLDADPPPFHNKVTPEKDARVDRRNIGRMITPGIFFLETMFAPAGSGAQEGNMEGALEYRNCQYMTPETRRTTHFFFNYLHNYSLDDPNVSRSLRDSMIEGFMEDKHIIEAQQMRFDEDPQVELRAIRADVAMVHFRSLMDRKMAAQRGGGATAQAAE